MKKLSPNRERRKLKADEARAIVSRLANPSITLSGRELVFVLSMFEKLKRADYVSGKQLGWLRALDLKYWGAGELERAVGRE